MPVVYQVVGFGRGDGRHSGRHRRRRKDFKSGGGHVPVCAAWCRRLWSSPAVERRVNGGGGV